MRVRLPDPSTLQKTDPARESPGPPAGGVEPVKLTTGLGLMEIIPFNISLQKNPKYSLTIIRKAIQDAIILKSHRPDVERCVNEILEIVDKYAF